MNGMDIRQEIARLVRFAADRALLEEEDRIPAANALLDLLQVEEPYDGELGPETAEGPSEILEGILDYAAERGILQENTTTRRDLLDAKIMGLLMPRQSEVQRSFRKTAQDVSIRQATDDYYQMSIASNYIRMDRIRRNLYWEAPTEFGNLEITINLSKPEKDPKEIAAERSAAQSSYPKCLLCVENVGYAGRLNHPARQNHRVIPVTLAGTPWFLQYSPYVYYNEHCIVLSEQHSPMKISRDTFVRLLEFVEKFPHYFLGSNADLPIVGGSILNHDHFQGGRHRFPMEKAPVDSVYKNSRYPGVTVGTVKWPMSVIRIAGDRIEELVELADEILMQWRNYSDSQADILAYSEGPEGRIPHNTVTPIARRNENGQYELDLVLRNNRTTEEHPLGIFHPHADLHHIKKENIGLIEVMGLAVLPGRLKEELAELRQVLTGEMAAEEITRNPEHSLYKHAEWLAKLTAASGGVMKPTEADAFLRNEVGDKFLRVLLDAGVYKRDEAGKAAFVRFMEQLGMER